MAPPKKDTPRERIQITLAPETIEALDRLSGGNRSRLIETLILKHEERMTMKSASKETITKLNALFKAAMGEDGNTNDAAETAARALGFTERVRDDTCVVFSRDTDVVNCWIDNVHPQDMGFDDQWEWANERFEDGMGVAH